MVCEFSFHCVIDEKRGLRTWGMKIKQRIVIYFKQTIKQKKVRQQSMGVKCSQSHLKKNTQEKIDLERK